MKLLQTSLSTATFMMIVSMLSFAEMNIRISEDSTTVNGVETSLDSIWNNKKSTSYTVNGQDVQLNGRNNQAIKKKNDNIQFEVYGYGENYTSHSIYSSGAGVCHAFVGGREVELKDSSIYYVKDSKTGDYYAAIVGADVSKGGAKNVQYAPIFNIKDPKLLEQIRKQEQNDGKKIVEKNISERGDFLENVICR
ncbi:hypothetical protein [Actinobacillus porcinus]|uniref:DUF8095 domain-containing protein n=1 Tax=Actinobacillus porcinus TaxID=51048 RepID=A0ABY6TIE6_9PAST|nr:hypothetical protein [Actinobacillus porcinus]MDY5421228.1 hypothetical protein [Actinobacillus porcinus]MDY5847483.1 hypothetical protein [Actinobacillus porcinus]VFY92455.1 Uncharacterised protein [Actinobacillus porcinus]VTU06457.1 Uncharacterised protein [Actinobacillus porcinus]